jgi:DNA-binding NarL/FixJ family response regulator
MARLLPVFTEGDDRMAEKSRILIVDDSASFRRGMRALLEIQPDMQVVGEAPDGDKALEWIEKLRPNLVLLDAQMPGMTGVEATRLIKSRWPQTKVILMTMYPDYRSKSIEAGTDAFMTKGIPPEQLLAIIRGISRDEESNT